VSNETIRVRNLGKEYAIGVRERPHESLREALSASLSAPWRRWRRMSGRVASNERFWALRDVNFSVSKGEVVGIIGRNGAGKSTLLKILSQITAPTTGRVELRGRLSSLLEVGTGFHPELTGRENVFLNGAVLGMRRSEIEARFDEIVAFSEVERFLDTPVKRYSSGMYVRLAFAVAAHLEPEILVVDEVLAVGDAAFQRKCLGKMGSAAGSGRTVLFVSHNMAAITALCSRALCLTDGTVVVDGRPQEAIAAYLANIQQAASEPLTERGDRIGDGRLRFTGYWLENRAGERIPSAMLGGTVVLCLGYEAIAELEEVYVAFDLRDLGGEAVTNCNTADVGADFARVAAGQGVFRCELPRFPIRAGRYTGNIYCAARGQICDFLQAAIVVDVEDGDFYGTGSLRNTCRVMLDQRWSLGQPAGERPGFAGLVSP